ncbi:MAG: UDP-galactopyranose mutase [Muricomes sp.]
MKENEIIIVGAGFAGGIMARKFAEAGKRVTIIERRNHIGGNMYDYVDDNGIRLQKYGPHTFHTNIDDVFEFLSKYCTLNEYRLKCEAVVDGVSTPSPFNFKTIDQFYDVKEAEKLKAKLLNYYQKESATVLEMLNSEDEDIKSYAEFLFDRDYRLYTAKQWGIKPEEIDPSVLKRVPIVFNYNDTYFYDKYEGIPSEGFTGLFDNLLNHSNISVILGKDAREHISVDIENSHVLFDGRQVPIVYTGAIDELFGYIYGHLPYRSLHFEYEYYLQKDYQNVAIVAHPAEADFTRITEYTKLPYQEAGNKTVIAREFPMSYDPDNTSGNEPYYPVLTAASQQIYKTYESYAEQFQNLILCGRLADFKYYNMDMVIKRTLSLYEEIKDKFI